MALTDEMCRLTQRLGEDHDKRTAAVARELSEFQTDRQAKAETQRQQRRVYMGELSSDTSVMLTDLGVARGNLSREQKLGFDECNKLRQVMADERRQRLSEEDHVLRGEVRAFCTQIRTERAEARQVWTSYSLMRQHVACKSQEILQSSSPPAREKAESPTVIVKPVAPEPGEKDDLKAILGIGPSMERRLHRAGIYRYAQLATMTVERLRVAAVAEPFVKVENWIERARELMEQK